MGPMSARTTSFDPQPLPIRWIALLLFALAANVHALDRERAIGDFYHTGWTVKQGAPGQIAALAQTSDGFLWLATQVGLFRFDGVTFERFEPAVGEHLLSDSVSALFASRSGALWVGYRYGGASLVANGRVVNFTEAGGFSTGSVFGFAEQRDGTVWAATYQGLMRRSGGRWEWVREDWGLDERQVRAVLVDREGAVWLAARDSLYVLPAGTHRFHVAATGIGQASQLAQAPDGSIWVAELDGGVRRLPPGAPAPAATTVEVATAAVSLLFDRDGALWVGSTGDGLHRLAHPERLADSTTGAASRFREPAGLTADYIGPALEDREGNVWFGTARGLDRFRAARFVPAGLPRGSFDFALVAGEADVVWAGTRNRPLLRVQVPSVVATTFDQPVSCAIRDRDGAIWLGGPGGIWRMEGESPARVASLPERAPSSAVQALTVDQAGVLWVSLNVPGVFKLEQGAWTHLEHHPGLLERASPLTLLTDDAGRVWMGYSRSRITRARGDAMRLYTAADGLEVGNVTALVDGPSRVWIGGEWGLAIEEGAERFRSLRARDAASLEGITGLIERANGDLWLNGSRGVVHLLAAEVRRAVEDPAYLMVAERFDYLDGLPGAPAQFRPLPTAIEGGDGRLWFATTSGVVWIDPDHVVRNTLPPPVAIRALRFGDRTLSPGDDLRLPSRTNALQVRYTALSLSIPERIRFRYRLEGLEDSWHDAGAAREASFNNLGPGKYRFRVVAANDDGVWNDAGASLDFSVAPTFSQTWWFRALGVLVAFGVLWILYLARLRELGNRIRLRAHERHLERERIARELHDTLLQSVQGLILRFQVAADAATDADTRRALESALDRADAVLAEGRDRVKDLRVSAEGADDLAHALDELGRELAEGNAARFRLDVVGEARPLARLVQDEVYRVGREALINAFRHAQAQTIAVELAFSARRFDLRVSDDGRGIATDVLDAGGRAGHWGLTGMKERARRVGGELVMNSRAGEGTTIALGVPGTIAFAAESAATSRRSFWRWRPRDQR